MSNFYLKINPDERIGNISLDINREVNLISKNLLLTSFAKPKHLIKETKYFSNNVEFDIKGEVNQNIIDLTIEDISFYGKSTILNESLYSQSMINPNKSYVSDYGKIDNNQSFKIIEKEDFAITFDSRPQEIELQEKIKIKEKQLEECFSIIIKDDLKLNTIYKENFFNLRNEQLINIIKVKKINKEIIFSETKLMEILIIYQDLLILYNDNSNNENQFKIINIISFLLFCLGKYEEAYRNDKDNLKYYSEDKLIKIEYMIRAYCFYINEGKFIKANEIKKDIIEIIDKNDIIIYTNSINNLGFYFKEDNRSIIKKRNNFLFYFSISIFGLYIAFKIMKRK